MSVFIPRTRVRSLTMRPRLFSGEQEGTLGGADLPVPRMGDRWIAEINTAQLRFDDAGRDLVAALTQALTQDGIISIGQPNLAAPIATDALTNGANQGGTSFAIRAAIPGATIPRSAYLSVIHGGRRHVHLTTATVTVSAQGQATLSVWPMLRFLTVDGSTVELIDPKIEGRLTGFAGATWVRNRVDPLTFSVSERQ